MLKTRIITAVLLLAVLLPTLFAAPVWAFTGLMLIFVAGAAWEWGRLNGLQQVPALVLAAGCLLGCIWIWCAGGLDVTWPVLWLTAAALWVGGGAWMLRGGVTAWLRVPAPTRCLVGVGVLWVAWLALTQARMLSIAFLLSVLSLVWVADIAAYVVGRMWGGRIVQRKLAASISPGKSWEGSAGALLATLLMASSWAVLAPAGGSLYATLLMHHGWAFMLSGTAGLTAMSVAGDLIESLMKRAAGVKDSSALLPGHGGVLDRIDALLPVLPLAMALALTL